MLIFHVLFSLQTYYHLCLWLWNIFFFFCQKSCFLYQRWHEHCTAHKERLPIGLLWAPPYLHNLASSFSWLYKNLVTAFVLSRLDYCNSLLFEKLQKVQNSAARLVLKAHKRDHVSPFSELFTGCPSEYISSKSCQHSVTPFSLMQPLFICLTFSVSTLHQDSSTPPLTQELYTFHT